MARVNFQQGMGEPTMVTSSVVGQRELERSARWTALYTKGSSHRDSGKGMAYRNFKMGECMQGSLLLDNPMEEVSCGRRLAL